MTITKFVIRHGRIALKDAIPLSALDEQLLDRARKALADLWQRQATASFPLSTGTEGIVGLGLPPSFDMPVERLSESLRETWHAGWEARERKQKGTNFYVTTSEETELFSLAREAAVFGSTPSSLSSTSQTQIETTNLATLYGAVVGTFGAVELRKAGNERDLRPSAERIQQFWEVATQIVAAAPAFMCNGRLNGPAAGFADCFAIAMLSDPDVRL